MPSVRRATIANELSSQVAAWLEVAHKYLPQDTFEFKSFIRAAERLAGPDPYASSLLRAYITHMSGDVEGARYWLRNARNWPHDEDSLDTEIVIVTNLGFFSDGASLIDGGKLTLVSNFASLSLVCGSFKAVLDRLPGTPLAGGEQGAADIELAERCQMALNQIGVSEQQVQAMLDIAGSVLRRHRMFFSGDRPVIRAIHDGLLYQLVVRADAVESAAMTDEVLTELVEKELDAPGLAFSFIPYDA